MIRRGETRTRSVRAGVAATLLTGALAAGCGGADEEPAADDPLAAVRADPRVALLLEPCERNAFYDRDTSDVVAFLVEKLERGRPDQLKRAKEELGELGADSIEEIERFLDRHATDALHSPYVEIAIDAVTFNTAERAHDVLLRALAHPQESVRRGALVGLTVRHARPADFELLRERLEGGFETPEIQRSLVAALFAADATRAEAYFLDAFEKGEHAGLWSIAAQRYPPATDPATAARCAQLFPRLEPPLAVLLAACAARAGDARALEYVDAELQSEERPRRLGAVVALGQAKLGGRLEHVLREDPDDQLRVFAADAVAQAGELDDQRRDWLRAALDDPAAVVRASALKLLCERGDPEAIGRALQQLGGEAGDLQAALPALREPMSTDPELARRALERLLERHALEEHRPIQRRTGTLKAIGLVPLAEAAAFLRRLAPAADTEEIEGLRAHEWLMIQASNTGVPGRTFLADELAREDDPVRRLDLIDALGSKRDELARERLRRLCLGEARSEMETLFAASRWIKVGPSWDVAPSLKRVSYEMQELTPRLALQCLLWMWY